MRKAFVSMKRARPAPMIAMLLALLPALASQAIAQLEVSTASPERKRIQQTITVKADLHPLYEVTLKARVTGTIESIAYEDGDIVKAADGPIATLAVPDLEAGLAKATAEVNAAKAGVNDAQSAVRVAEQQIAICEALVLVREAEVTMRMAQRKVKAILARRRSNLLSEDAATQEQVDEASAELETAKADESRAEATLRSAQAEIGAAQAKLSAAQSGVQKAEAMRAMATSKKNMASTLLGFARIESPYPEAVVTMRHVDRGALIQADQSPIVDLIDLHQVRCYFDVPEEVATLIAPGPQGTQVRIRVSVDPGNPIDARITRVSSRLHMMTRSRRAEVVLDNAERRYLPGMFAYVEMIFESAETSFSLPMTAILHSRGKPHLYVVEGGKVRRRDISLGIDNGTFIEITTGLNGTEKVIAKGLTGLREGDPVKVME